MGFSAQEAISRAVSLGFDEAGIALPHSDSLPPWVRSVLVCLHATLDPAFDFEMFISYEGKEKWYKPIYTAMESLSFRLAGELEKEGLKASALTFQNSIALIDLKRAAVEAGLGVLGRNNLVIHRRYGPRFRLGAVFTDADWPAGPPLVDYYCPSCTLCWNACQTQALGPGGLERTRCIAEFEPSPALARMQKELDHRPTPCTRAQCIDCVTSCPIGSRIPTHFGLSPIE